MTFQIPELDAFGISPKLGFLSRNPPVTSFTNTRYVKWDDLANHLPELISSRSLRSEIDELPYIDPADLLSELDQQRAYVVLAFLIHAYVWGDAAGLSPIEVIPPQLSEPFLHVCDELAMQPVLSYAGLCLWNWRLGSSAHGTTSTEFFGLEQLESVGSFTGSRGEDAFYHVPVLIEAEGGPLVALLLDAVMAAQQGNSGTVREALIRTTETIVRMKAHLPKLYSTLDAGMFYNELRPFFGGGKGMEDRGLPRGFVFQRRDGSEEVVKCIGGSAAQSSLFQYLDLVLGVEHESPGDKSESMFETMRSYMPGKHREFLEEVSKLPAIRSFVQKNMSDEALCGAFDDCIKQLRQWRSSHIAVVSKYIIRPARLLQAAKDDVSPQADDAASSSFEATDGENLKGTGGSALIPFLKQTRDETMGVNNH